jgi:DNA polymerase-3 subunit chi
MTKVDFYFNVPDKFSKTVQLCEQALVKGRLATIFTENTEMNAAIQTLLWQHSATSFLPSSSTDSEQSVLVPIVLAHHGESLCQDDVLINLQKQHPPFFSRFRQLVELVGMDEEDKIAARQRFKFYRDRGYQIQSIDVSKLE